MAAKIVITRTIVEPISIKPKPRRKLTREEAGIRHGLSHFYAMKGVIEELFGNDEFMKVKMSASMAEWRKQCCRILDAVALSVKSTVHIADDEWFDEVAKLVSDGKTRVEESDTIDEMFARFSAIMTRIVFTQIGNMPSRYRAQKKVTLTPDWWTLDPYRTVQYVQNPRQRANLTARTKRRQEAAQKDPGS
ncbi:hypothetical protein [Bradyrhizobium sp. OAE829]|uniref:hypothetical protein n=1 Tax=Bradyrhizobium sp. OAE829 TaxID=2663807 RepID=UPI00178BA50A